MVKVRGYASTLRPILFVLSGSAVVKNPIIDNEIVIEFSTGGVIGDSDLLRYPGIDFFGDIYAGKKGLECLILMTPEQVIDEFEKPILKEVMKRKYFGLQQ